MIRSEGDAVSILVEATGALEVLVAGEPVAEKTPNKGGFREYPYAEA